MPVRGVSGGGVVRFRRQTAAGKTKAAGGIPPRVGERADIARRGTGKPKPSPADQAERMRRIRERTQDARREAAARRTARKPQTAS